MSLPLPATYAVDLLAELDDLQWADRIGLADGLDDDELTMAIAERTGTYRQAREAMLAARVLMIETIIYATRRRNLPTNRAARAAGMRTAHLRRWLTSYDEGR